MELGTGPPFVPMFGGSEIVPAARLSAGEGGCLTDLGFWIATGAALSDCAESSSVEDAEEVMKTGMNGVDDGD